MKGHNLGWKFLLLNLWGMLSDLKHFLYFFQMFRDTQAPVHMASFKEQSMSRYLQISVIIKSLIKKMGDFVSAFVMGSAQLE